MTIRIRQLGLDEAPELIDLVDALLEELGEERDDCPRIDRPNIITGLREAGEGHTVFAARDDDEIIGIITVAESFAIYANGRYGMINEMYVRPSHRSERVGTELLSHVVSLGQTRGWTRIDVTAPESIVWARTRAFYENAGFTFAGPKLKLVLS